MDKADCGGGMTPNPKKKRIKLSPKEYRELRKKVHKIAGGYCEICLCTYAPIESGHVHHVKSVGAGGNDSADNCIWVCYVCHRNIHNGVIRRERAVEALEGR